MRGNETFLLAFNANIYEPLVRRNRELQVGARAGRALGAALAHRLALPSAPRRAASRDGTPFTADDVRVLLQRARAPGSNIHGRASPR